MGTPGKEDRTALIKSNTGDLISKCDRVWLKTTCIAANNLNKSKLFCLISKKAPHNTYLTR